MEDALTRLWGFLLPYYSDPGFWISVIVLLGFVGLLQTIKGVTASLLNYIARFFSPTVQPGTPPTKPGPSPFQRFIGCLGGLIGLVIVFFVLGIIGYSLILGLLQ